MLENVLFIALVVLGVTEVIFIVAFIMMKFKIDELKLDYDFFKEILKNNNEMIDKLYRIGKENENIYERMYSIIDGISDQYTKIYEAYNTMNQSYLVIGSQFKKLLSTWEEVAEDYQNSYEEYKHCVDELKSLKTMLDPEKHDAEDLGAQYVKAIEADENKLYPYDYNSNPYFKTVFDDGEDENPFLEKKAENS